jgi:hypothetical protein
VHNWCDDNTEGIHVVQDPDFKFIRSILSINSPISFDPQILSITCLFVRTSMTLQIYSERLKGPSHLELWLNDGQSARPATYILSPCTCDRLDRHSPISTTFHDLVCSHFARNASYRDNVVKFCVTDKDAERSIQTGSPDGQGMCYMSQEKG